MDVDASEKYKKNKKPQRTLPQSILKNHISNKLKG